MSLENLYRLSSSDSSLSDDGETLRRSASASDAADKEAIPVPVRRDLHSLTVSTPSGRDVLLEKGNKIVETVLDKQGNGYDPNDAFRLSSVDSRTTEHNRVVLAHSSRAYAAVRLPMQQWLEEGTNRPNEKLTKLLESVGVKVAAWEQTTWFGEPVALLLLFCTFADHKQGGLYVVKSMVALDTLGVHSCLIHQELSNIASHREICPWEQLLFMRYVWTGILEFLLERDVAQSILHCTPAVWAIHDEISNSEIWKVCRSGAPQRWCECLGNPGACAYRLWAWLNIDLRPVEIAMYDTFQMVHGTDIAVYFVFSSSVIRSLGFLSLLVVPFLIWSARSGDDSGCSGADWQPDCFKDSFAWMGRPMLALVLCMWSCHLLMRWRLVYASLRHRWHIEESTEFQKILPETRAVVREHFRPYPSGSGTYPVAFRAVRTLVLVPCIFLCWMLIALMLAATFYLEMYIVYEWADCRKKNKAAGEAGQRPSCDGANLKYGFFGTIIEAMPGALEGILFEIAKVFAHKCSTLVCDFQNWRTYSDYALAYKMQVYSLEFISKFCVIGSLAFFFVPDWGMEDYTNKKYWEITDEDCADLFLGTFGPSCLQLRTPYELRLKLLTQSMVGCFIVAPIVSMLITCVVPNIFKSFVFSSAHSYLRQCWLWRLLLVAFYLEEDAVGGCCNYVLTGREKPVHNLRQDGVALNVETPLKWSTVVRQGYQKVFNTTNGYIDLVLHVNFIATFGVVFPLGVIINLLIVMLRLRGEVFMVLFARQRRLNQYAQQTETQQKWIDVILACQLVIAVIFNSLLLMLPFRFLEYWYSEYQNKPVNAFISDLVLCCFFVIVGFGFVILVLKDWLHFLPMPALQFVQDWRQHMRSQQIDLDYALRRDCSKALDEYNVLRRETQQQYGDLCAKTQDECDALRQELKQVYKELSELRCQNRDELLQELKQARKELAECHRWQGMVHSNGQCLSGSAGKAWEPELEMTDLEMSCEYKKPIPSSSTGRGFEGKNETSKDIGSDSMSAPDPNAKQAT